jgi:hypothetical protein
MQVGHIISVIDSEIERLQQARSLLLGVDGKKVKNRGVLAAPKAAKKATRKHRLSAEGRQRLSEALKKRWAERRKNSAKNSK